MPSSFAITAATNSVQLNSSRSGMASFTVFNGSGRRARGRANIVPLQDGTDDWYTLDGDTERPFEIAGTSQYTVQIAVPPDAPAGSHSFRLDMVGVENPDEDFTQGPIVTFDVPEPEEKKPFPWKIPAIIAAVVLVVAIAGVGFIFTRGGGPLQVPEVAAASVVDATETLTGAGFVVADQTQEESSDSVAQGMVIRTDPPVGSEVSEGGTVTLVVSSGPQVASAPVTIGQGPDTLTNLNTADFSFAQPEGTQSGSLQCQIDTGTWQDCPTGTQQYQGLEDGLHIFSVRVAQDNGSTSIPITYTWRVDTQASAPVVETAPPARTNELPVDIAFSNSESVNFECELNGVEWAMCGTGQSASVSYDNLVEGSYNLQIRATDEAGNQSEPVAVQWTIDTTPPVSTISSSLANPETPTNSLSIDFSFQVETGAILQCELDGVEWVACDVQGQSFDNLSEGQHIFRVRAIDVATNVEDPPAQYVWNVDLTGPQVSFVETPIDPTNIPSASFTVSSADALAVDFECQLNGADWQSCGSGETTTQTYDNLGDDTYTLFVRATDVAGNTGDPQSFMWTVDTQTVIPQIETKPSKLTSDTLARFVFSSDDAVNFECQLNSEGWLPCDSVNVESGTAVGERNYANLGSATHTFQVRSIDNVGNKGDSASYEWRVDTIGPDATVSNPPASLVNTALAVFNLTSSEANSTFECRIDNELWDNCSSGQSYSGLADGSHTFRVRATDEVGNTGTAVSSTWTVDTTPPETTLSSAPARETNSQSASFGFTSERGTTFQCKMDDGNWSSCPAEQSYPNLSEGAHKFRVRAVDTAGNADATPSVHNWTIDVTAPQITIQALVPIPFSPPFYRYQAIYNVTDALSGIEIIACGLNQTGTQACNNGSWVSPQPLPPPQTFCIMAIDKAGNQSNNECRTQ